MKTKKQIEMKRITWKNEKEHNKYFKFMRYGMFILCLPIILPLLVLNKIGEIAETINCLLTDILTKFINNIFILTHYDECRDLDEWEIEELEEQKQRKKMKKEERNVKYYVD